MNLMKLFQIHAFLIAGFILAFMIQCKVINAGEDENPFQFILITPLKILAMFVGENLQSKSLILSICHFL